MSPLRRPRTLTVAVGAAAVAYAGCPAGTAATATQAATAAHRQVYRVPGNNVLTIVGHGYGHGHGMSQFGAYGAAIKGLTADQIVAFYYPHTTLAGVPLTTRVRVLLHSTSSSRLVVEPGGGRLTASTSVSGAGSCALPASLDGGKTTVAQWRAKVMSVSGHIRLRLQATTDGKSWTHLPKKTCGAAWAGPLDGDISFTGRSMTRLVRSSGGVTRYRGSLRAAFTGSHIIVVNDVPIDSYLRSVVPSEMPSSWSAAALQAQAIAARTYASYGIAHPKSKAYYDVFDDTRDQMYTGVGSEASSSDAAVVATENAKQQTATILEDSHGDAAFTQFSSSDGGWTVAGGESYLPAQRDPYDGVPSVSWNPHTWSTTVSASGIASAFPSIGRLRAVVVDSRDGHGQWGGRITSLTLRGSSGHVALTGSEFRYDLGLRSEWFQVLEPPDAPTDVTAVRSGDSVHVGWVASKAHSGAPVRGYRVVAAPGGPSVSVGKNATTATLTGLHRGTSYTVTVTPTSRAGSGGGTTVTTKVARIGGRNRISDAVAVSRASYAAGKAGGVVLAGRQADAFSYAAAPLAAVKHAPLLLTNVGSLPSATKKELQRVLPAGRPVYLLGPTSEINRAVAVSLRGLGYHVVRFGGGTPDVTARHIADAVAASASVRNVVEVSATEGIDAWPAGPAAAARHGVVLLTAGSQQSPATAKWLAAHQGIRHRYAIGAAAAAADPSATAVTGSDAAVASRFFAGPQRAGVVSVGQPAAAVAEAARLATQGAPLLIASGSGLPAPDRDYIRAMRDKLRAVELVGGQLPYDDVELDVQRALLGKS
ncbi:MAG: SpoIID/LytB domain-containing protein [Frankiales bacterium]|nr:SpoIID/LytB domain-containing protein [Frankiales bacterium]